MIPFARLLLLAFAIPFCFFIVVPLFFLSFYAPPAAKFRPGRVAIIDVAPCIAASHSYDDISQMAHCVMEEKTTNAAE